MEWHGDYRHHSETASCTYGLGYHSPSKAMTHTGVSLPLSMCIYVNAHMMIILVLHWNCELMCATVDVGNCTGIASNRIIQTQRVAMVEKNSHIPASIGWWSHNTI